MLQKFKKKLLLTKRYRMGIFISTPAFCTRPNEFRPLHVAYSARRKYGITFVSKDALRNMILVL